MHLTEDNRDLNNQEDEEKRRGRISAGPFESPTEEIDLDDSEALKLGSKNPLAEEEGQEEDDNGGD